jgi:hypothetical protein
LLLALLDGCVAVPANGLSVFVAPNFATVQTGQTQQFTSTVTGSSNTAVTWSARGGTISSTGLYTAPSTTGTYTVTATSVADSTKSGSATASVSITPTSGSWLNQVERWFGLITEPMIRRGTFHSGRELEHAVYEWLAKWNEKPKPFTWSATADVILEQGRPSQRILEDTTLTTLIVLQLDATIFPFAPALSTCIHIRAGRAK